MLWGSQAVGNLEQMEATPRGLLPWDAAPRAGPPGVSFCEASTLTKNKSPPQKKNKFPNANINTRRMCAPVDTDLRTRLGVLTSLEVPGSQVIGFSSFIMRNFKRQQVATQASGPHAQLQQHYARPADTLQWPQADTQVVAPQAPGTSSLYLISASGPKKWCAATVASGRTLQYSSRGMSTVGEQGGTLRG